MNSSPSSGCPKCQSNEINSQGLCLVCGYQASAPDFGASTEKSPGSAGGSGALTIDAADDSEIPEWRKQLSTRLQKIKQKREAHGETPSPPDPPPAPPARQKPVVTEAPIAGSAAEIEPAPKPRRAPRKSLPEAEPAPPPPQSQSQTLPLFQDLFPASSETSGAQEEPGISWDEIERPRKESDDLEALIDRLVQRQPAGEAEQTPSSAPPEGTKAPAGTQDKLILLSRTLSGLVDLIIVVMCGSVFILAADFFSGIRVFDSRSATSYALLTMAIFFLYSIYFLGTINQTIGMMITELRVVDRDLQRPRLAQLMLRSATFLLSLLPLGLGLVWGCIDRDSDCLHDKLSRTRVVRLMFPGVYSGQ